MSTTHGPLHWTDVPEPTNSVATGAPTISGTPAVAETLTADVSGIADENGLDRVKFHYQWARSDGAGDTGIEGATGASYTLTTEHGGKSLRVRVSFVDRHGFAESLTSGPVGVAASDANIPATGAPTISGTARVGETLTADTSGIADSDGLDNVTYAYQWIRNDGASDTDIQDATGATYTLVSDDEGKTIKVRVSFSDDLGNPETLTSEATAAVEPAPNSPATGLPTISGTAQVGQILTADTTGIDDEDGLTKVSYSYQWIRNDGKTDSDIQDATSSNYTLSDNDVGETIKVQVSFTDDAGNEETLTSEATTAVAAESNNPATGEPTISGAAQVGETLTVETSAIDDADGLDNASFSYQWIANDGTTDTDIQGATASTYTLVSEDEGKTVRVRVSFSDDLGNEETLTSEATAAVEPAPDSPATGEPTISGAAQVGETLTVETSAIDDADGLDNASFSYQWIANDGTTDSDIPGATEATYTLSDSDKGKATRVRVSFTDDAGNQEALTSSPTDVVVARPNSPATGQPTIGGTAQVGETLTVDTSAIEDDDGLTNATFSYQWVADDADIAGATGSSYTLTDSDECKAIKVKVSFTDDAGNEESLTSAPIGPNRPCGLTAAVSDGAVVLTWKPPVGQSYMFDYQILRNRPELGEAEPLVHVEYTETEETTYTDTDVEPGVLYVYRVKAVVDVFGRLGEASEPVEIRTAEPTPAENSPAAGAPTISGTAQVGETLTADTSGIADSDGLDNVSFTYQWLAHDTDIAGATDSSYTLTASEAGKAIKVRVSFTDDAGNVESLTSAPIAPDRPYGLTAGLSGNAVVLTWKPPVGQSYMFDYQILRNRPELGEAEPLVYVTYTYTEETAYTDTDVEPGVLYVYRVKAVVDVFGRLGEASEPVEIRTAEPTPGENSPATGAPTISGTVRVGETLTADTSGIADSDGLDNVSFTYQWLADDTDIAGATGSSYTLTDSDVGKAIKVRVSFTDDEGNEETLTSAATSAVAAAPTPLTAQFLDTPSSHDGQTAFTFELRFSEEFDLSYVTLRDHAFTVTGGEVTGARRLDKPGNIRWEITVRPDGDGEVTVALPATEDCEDPGAICTGDGRRLSAEVTFTVARPGE